MQLKGTALGLALGIIWGVSVFVVTLWAVMRGGGGHLYLLGQFYIGYSVSFVGAILGLVYGFIDGFVCGWLLAWLYNRFAGSTASS